MFSWAPSHLWMLFNILLNPKNPNPTMKKSPSDLEALSFSVQSRGLELEVV